MAIYKILVSKSVGVYYDVEANSKDEAINKFNNGEDCGEGYGEYDVDSFVVNVRERGLIKSERGMWQKRRKGVTDDYKSTR